MKRHIHKTGVRDYHGDDFIELQSEPLKALDAFFAPYPACIVSGCKITQNEDLTFNVSAGMVTLDAQDPETEQLAKHIMPFGGVENVALPIYLVPEVTTETRVYNDGKTKPIAYNYAAVASGVEPDSEHIVVGENPVRFVDAVQDPSHQFITADDRTKWNALQGAITTAISTLQTAINDGDTATLNSAKTDAQTKATKALNDANGYTDTKATATLNSAKTDAQTKATAALNSANSYTNTKLAEFVASAPDTLNTLNELAAALGDDPNFSTTVMAEIGKRATTASMNAALAGKADSGHGHNYVVARGIADMNEYHHGEITAGFGWSVANAPFGGDILYLTITNPWDSYDKGLQFAGRKGLPLFFRGTDNGSDSYEPWKRLVTSTDLATTTAAGLMSPVDKTKLDSLPSEINGSISSTGTKIFCNANISIDTNGSDYTIWHYKNTYRYTAIACILSAENYKHADNTITCWKKELNYVIFRIQNSSNQAVEAASFDFNLKFI